MREAGFLRRDVVVAVLLTTLVLGVGVALGAQFFARGAPPAPTGPSAGVPPEAPAPAAAPGLAAPAAPDAARRLDEVERGLADLRASVEKSQEQAKPLLDLYAKSKEEGTPALPVEGSLSAHERQATGDDARKVASDLGLDARRREAMATQYAETLTELEALEKQNATVTKEGDVTTVKIAKFPDAGRQALQRWQDWVERNLTRPEKEAYDRGHQESVLFGVRGGQFDRTVKIDETGGAIKVSESITTKDGEQEVMELGAPASARDVAIGAYRHLLGEGKSEK
jgi:hypothetical protein